LIAKDPSNKEFYEKNLKDYTEKLDKLDKEAKEKFNNIPAEKKLIVTSEGCFKYFSKAYVGNQHRRRRNTGTNQDLG